MAEYLEKIGIGPGTYRLDNGSGLSHSSHLSARQIAKVLVAAYQDGKIGHDFLQSLSIGGRDGTLRARFRGHPSEGWVFGKTGTLNGAWALSGFVTTSGAPELCFAIVTNGGGGKHKVRAQQVALVDAMYRYLAKRNGVALSATTPSPAEPNDGDDDEVELLHPY